MLFDGEGDVGGRHCRVRADRIPGGIALTVEGAGRFLIRRDEDRMVVEARLGRSPAALEEALFGPAIVLFLAQRGVFCLHASSVRCSGLGALAFTGDSGAGKSTLCRLLTALPGVEAVADDILAMGTDGPRGVEVRPHFPQLKLSPQAMERILSLPARLSLGAICALNRRGGGSEVRLERISAGEAAATAVRQTVAARLFDRELLAAHLDFAGLLATTPFLRLTYPSRTDVAESILRAIRAELRDNPSTR